MAWLQNLAGHAENLLNKIDQNAATVLSDGNKPSPIDEELSQDGVYELAEAQLQVPPTKSKLGPLKLSRSPTPEVVNSTTLEKPLDIFTPFSESQKSGSAIEEKLLQSSHTSVSSSSSRNSFIAAQELEAIQSKLAKLELENQDVNKQLLNIQHLYSEIRNENVNLQFQVDRLNEQLALAQSEKEQYVARAQRILQEKEKLIALKQENSGNEIEKVERNIYMNYNEEQKKELELQQLKVMELTDKNSKLLSDLQSLQMQHQVIQQGLTQSNQSLEQNLLNEKRLRIIAEDDCSQKLKEVQLKIQETMNLHAMLKQTSEDNMKLKEVLQRRPQYPENGEYESRIRSLTQTLMLKQNKLETITTDRNALKLQLEKLEAEYRKNIADLKREGVKIINVQDGERISVPHFMRVSPHDAGMTRRVKHAYSSLDAVSIRTGIFLRRYPLARVFVFFYMVILHIWVFTVLLWDVPSQNR
ncbi:golgin subfamily A member 5 isoform X2 [Euwallacea similis]|uniref:golgin subfamily A member 5 isoform X2 n=1 Tax=Euwallacea similis TaxID=1736056 RepID=UPI00344ED9B6